MTRRTVHSIAAIPVAAERPTLKTRDVSSHLIGDGMDPFLVTTLFEMRGPTFPPHPHAGFAVATYILPESATGFLNQDSTGHFNHITPGSIHATIAGSGVVHEETNEVAGTLARGFQIWLNVPAAKKHTAPTAVTLEAADVPVVIRDGATIRVLAGGSNGAVAPIDLPTAARIVDVTLVPGGRFRQGLTRTEQAFLWVISGTLSIEGDMAAGFEAVRIATDGDELFVEAGDQGARFVLFAGEPIGEPVVMSGPFVGSSRQDVDGFMAAYRAGRMGQLTPFKQQAA